MTSWKLSDGLWQGCPVIAELALSGLGARAWPRANGTLMARKPTLVWGLVG